MSEATAHAAQQLSDFVDLELARRLEMAEMILPDCEAALRRYAPNVPIAVEHVAGSIAYFGGPNYPANQAVGLGLHGEVSPAELDRVEDFFRSRGVPSTIVLSPLADPSLRNLLGNRGYGIGEFNSVLIRRIEVEEPYAEPPGVTIERVTPPTVGPWMRAIAGGFAQDITVAEEVFGGFSALPDALAFLARIGDTVAGGCGGRIIPQASIAALFGAATLPEFRRRGIQSALISRRLHEAALAGCEYAVVSTNPGTGSQRNMERRGFRLAYTRLVMVRTWPEMAAQPEGDNASIN
jgi:GNAT superfamily N-acetyltransferase